jgi:hypothetical protein
MEKLMNEVMALEVREDGVSSSNESELAAMARAAAVRAVAREVVAARSGTKEFQMEQQAKWNEVMQKHMEGLSKEEQLELNKQFVAELEAADLRETEADTEQYLQQLKATQPANDASYKFEQKLEYAIEEDDEGIVPKSRKEYVFWFKAQQRKSARATLEMCRTTYEAFKSLNDSEFNSFCMDVGYKDNSSTIRKFLAIGKVYPRLIQYAEQLPTAWTNIYLLTQISADDFELCIKNGFALNKLTGNELKELVDKTKDVNNTISPFKKDKKQLAYPVAKVFFTKLPDDIDYRLLQKALEEVQARLPVKFQFIGEQSKLFEKRAAQRYEKVKQEGKETPVKPSEWDYGCAANAVYDEKSQKLA